MLINTKSILLLACIQINLFFFCNTTIASEGIATKRGFPVAHSTAKQKRFAPTIFESKLQFRVYIRENANSSELAYIGSTPGKVFIPQCAMRMFEIINVNKNNCNDYAAEVKKWNIECLYWDVEENPSILHKCREIKMFDGITSLGISSLQSSNLDFLKGLNQIVHLHIASCELTDVSALSSLNNITTIAIEYCEKLQDLSPLQKMKNLSHLQITSCLKIDFSFLEKMHELKNLELFDCDTLKKSSVFSNLRNLRFLTLQGHFLEEMQGISKLNNLVGLKLPISVCLIDIEGISNLSQLEELDLSRCLLRKLDGISNLKNLRSLNLSHNIIENIEEVRTLKKLQFLSLRGCTSLKSISPVASLENLETLDITTNSLMSDEMRHLKKLKKLTNISLVASAEGKNGKSVSILNQCANSLPKEQIKYLALYSADVEALFSFAVFKNVEDLTLCYIDFNKSASTLGELPKLKSLTIISGKGIKKLPLFRNPNLLEELTLISCSELADVTSIKKMTNLKRLRVKNCLCPDQEKGLDK